MRRGPADRYDRSVDAELGDPVIVEFPLREDGWVAVHSPADGIPGKRDGVRAVADGR